MIAIIGKSAYTRVLAKALVRHVDADGMIVNCKGDPFYDKLYMPVHTSYTPEFGFKFTDDVMARYKSAPSVLVLDGLDKAMYRDPTIKNFCFNGRCMKTSLIINMESNCLSPEARCNVDFAFLFPDQDVSKKLYQQYAGIFPSLDDFTAAAKEYCPDSSYCLVIDCLSRSEKLEDNCFWYKVAGFD